jgi:hypothetical protein
MKFLVSSYDNLHASKKINAGLPLNFHELSPDMQEMLLTLTADIYKSKLFSLLSNAEEAAENLMNAVESVSNEANKK